METPDSIRDYWFGPGADDLTVAQQRSKLWWSKNPDADAEIRHRFEGRVQATAAGELDGWATTPRGMLALILLTDQFPRNMYRNTPEAFRFDPLAQKWCQAALARRMERSLRPIERVFLYLPLEHAEALPLQEESVRRFTGLYQEVPAEQMDTFRRFLMFALRHRRVIERFGRFPHRNAILGRESTAEEIEFLKEPGSSF
jgi:uncharacterized protein (DUF924 family)